jgi:hypothetical protein
MSSANQRLMQQEYQHPLCLMQHQFQNPLCLMQQQSVTQNLQ